MTIPDGSLFPDSFDTDDNLFLVHDSIRLRLSEDYNPGDKSIRVEGDLLILSRLPTVGLITLTEQCSEIDERAISFYYNGVDAALGEIQNLELLPEFNDVPKQKKITNVTQNVMDRHHNQIKDAIIAIEEFCGIEGEADTLPLGDTLEGRTNFLRKVVFQPKPWFTADKRIGIVPLEVEFKDLSFRLGTDGNSSSVVLTWDFGDNTTSAVSIISVTDEVPSDAIDVIVYDEDGGTVKKTYMQPGIYGVTLNVKNDFGEDSCYFPNFINARVEAPHEAVIFFREQTESQIVTPGIPAEGPFTVVPKIRSPINTLITIELQSGENPATPGFTYAGEPLNDNDQPIDPIDTYTWSLGDDLDHPSSLSTKASYGIGGIYDLKLRVDTEFGAYRITTYEDSIDIVENVNLWLWVYQSTNTVRAYEFGLISQAFKLGLASTLVVNRNSDFLQGVPNEAKQIQEFKRNVGFNPTGTLNSGRKGNTLLYWASGRAIGDVPADETIQFSEFNGFLGTYTPRSSIDRPWNWASFNSPSATYFLFGQIVDQPYPLSSSPTNVNKQTVQNSSHAVTEIEMGSSDFTNATELMQNVAVYGSDGEPIYGHYSTYRTSWKDNVGYLARNNGVGPYYRIKSFYKTDGSVGSPFEVMRKLQDIQGATKLEGELVSLADGVYFFNNTGSISVYNDTTGTWLLSGPGLNSVDFRSLQDSSVSNFDSPENTLLAASDGDRRAYLSYHYSPNAFLKFDQVDKTFSTLGSRPLGEQFVMGVY